MDLIELSKAQIEEIYYQRMKLDFSSNELKPLAMIFKATVNVVCFGVPFRLIEIPVAEPLSASEMKKLYRAHYKALLPPQMYEKNIEV